MYLPVGGTENNPRNVSKFIEYIERTNNSGGDSGDSDSDDTQQYFKYELIRSSARLSGGSGVKLRLYDFNGRKIVSDVRLEATVQRTDRYALQPECTILGKVEISFRPESWIRLSTLLEQSGIAYYRQERRL